MLLAVEEHRNARHRRKERVTEREPCLGALRRRERRDPRVIVGREETHGPNARVAASKQVGPRELRERFRCARVGAAHQIADDLLDERQDGAHETGGDTGCSLVPLVGVQAARGRAEALLVSALQSIEDLGQRAEPLRELARFAVRRDR